MYLVFPLCLLLLLLLSLLLLPLLLLLLLFLCSCINCRANMCSMQTYANDFAVMSVKIAIYRYCSLSVISIFFFSQCHLLVLS